MELFYRKARSEDLDEITALIAEAISEMRKNDIFQWDELYPTAEDFKADIIQNASEVVIISGKIAAVYALNEECEEQYTNGNWRFKDSSFKVLHRLCVRPEFQNKGIAKAVLVHIEERLRREDIKSIRLDAFSQNPYALRLYEKMGYIRVGGADFENGLFYLLEKRI